MMNRYSKRDYTGKRISLKELSTVIYYSAGLRRRNYPDIGNRFYPSAGSRYPIELYPIVLQCENISPGIYHYHLKTHSLEFLWTYPDLENRVFNNIKQPEFKTASVMFALTAVTSRSELKYGPRGYRYVYMEAGHVSQNFYLAAAGLNLGCCSVGGFLDDGIDRLLNIDGFIEHTLLMLSFG